MICSREEGEKKGKGGGGLMGKRERKGKDLFYSGQKKGLDRW